jgi:hypothetical protein
MRPMTARSILSVLALTASLALAACGSDDSAGGASAEEGSTPEQAVAEIGNVRTSLDDALAAVSSGDAAKADEILAEGYVEHFEKVEGPLEKVDPELKEELEETLATTLRDKVKAGASEAELQTLVDDVKADLDSAKGKLE